MSFANAATLYSITDIKQVTRGHDTNFVFWSGVSIIGKITSCTTSTIDSICAPSSTTDSAIELWETAQLPATGTTGFSIDPLPTECAKLALLAMMNSGYIFTVYTDQSPATHVELLTAGTAIKIKINKTASSSSLQCALRKS